MKIDAHQHFWKYSPDELPWISEDMAILADDYLPQDSLNLMQAAGVDSCIAVQARQSPSETQWLLDQAATYDHIVGVVGWMDLQRGSIGEQVEQFSNKELLVGIRHLVQDEEDPNFLLREAFIQGVQELSTHDLVYDILVFHHQLSTVIDFVGKLPQNVFVLDHVGKPDIKNASISEWETDIRRTAEYENVSCKVSGLITEADWESWRESDVYPYLDVVFDAFGRERLIFGSDYPVCKLAGSYQRVVDLIQNYVEVTVPEWMEDVFFQNTKRTYGLSL